MSRLAAVSSSEVARLPSAPQPVVAVRPVMLVVDNDPSAVESWQQLFGARFDVRVATAEAAGAMAETSPFDVVMVDVRSSADAALQLGRMRQRQPQAAIIAVGGADRAQAAVAALSQGATEFVLKPFSHPEDVQLRIEAALVRRRAGADAELLATPYSAARTSLIKNFDVRYLQGLMRATRGNISEASRRSGIDRANLRRMLKHHGISPVDFGAVRAPRPVPAAG